MEGKAKFIVRLAAEEDLPHLHAIAKVMGYTDEEAHFDKSFELQQDDVRFIYLAEMVGAAVGFVLLNTVPRYQFFQRLNIPEIHDLAVLPDYRRQGIGEALVKHCEAAAQEAGADHVGIAVGLHSGYGAAQRLYARLGYIPDGNGATYDRKATNPHTQYVLDDNLCLMMVKTLV